MTPTKQEMLKKIYEVIADKTLSFGCKILGMIPKGVSVAYMDGDKISNENQFLQSKIIYENTDMRDIEIIGHLVMIGDVYDYLEKQKVKGCGFEIIQLRENKRKAIDDQSEECIDFIYNLINNDTN